MGVIDWSRTVLLIIRTELLILNHYSNLSRLQKLNRIVNTYDEHKITVNFNNFLFTPIARIYCLLRVCIKIIVVHFLLYKSTNQILTYLQKIGFDMLTLVIRLVNISI